MTIALAAFLNACGMALAAVLNSFWQTAALALAVWATLRYLPKAGVAIHAATRCAVWWAVLAAVVLLPMTPQRATRPVAPPPATSIAETVAASPSPAAAVTLTRPVQPAQPASTNSGPLRMTAGAGVLAALAIWAAFSLLRLAQIVRSYRYLRGIKLRSQGVSAEQRVNFDYWVLACGIDRPARLLVSGEIFSPMAVGFREPAVIVPRTLLSEFTTDELDHVILHELAHIARRDDWTNLLARIAAALLPIHPVAVWVVKRIEQDREIACDDWVVAVTGEARPYAASLTRLFELCSARRRQLLATGMADRASHLGERIEALLRSGRNFAPRVSPASVALGALVLLALVLAGAQVPHWVAFAQEPPVAPLAPVAPMASAAPAAPAADVLIDDQLQRDLVNRQQNLEQALAQLQAAKRQLQDQPEQARLAGQIRAMQAQVRAREVQVQRAQQRLVELAQDTQGRAQLEQQRAREQAEQARVRAEEARAFEAMQRQQGRQGRSDSFLAALVAAGYGGISVDEIIDLRNHGVTADFLRAVGTAGPGKIAVKDLMALSDNGVRPDFYRAMREAFPQGSVREIIEAAQAGVQGDDLRQAREFSPSLTLPQLIKLKHAGVI